MVHDPSQRAAELFRAALDRPPAERLPFVTEACADSTQLRSEVEALLALHEEGRSFLDGLPALSPGSCSADEEEPPDELEPGTQLGDYGLTDRIGAGGMGVVYLAHDARLGRDVAIKVLRPQLASDVVAVKRLEREARLLASLNHPNVATIHSLERSGETRFLVLELVPGQTLVERVSAGGLTLREAFEICRQIGEGLEAAHARGVVHRDLNPANIKITPEGQVKLLDFGLAKPFASVTRSDVLEAGTLRNDELTVQGIVQGTVAYMSPEQARGEALDKRTDIWSFGCVLYELLSGRRAFPGRTLTETLAAVIERDPDWRSLPRPTPDSIATLLRHCLEKDPRRRLHDIADARIQLEETLAAPGGTKSLEAIRRFGSSRRLPWAMVVVMAVVTFWALWHVPPGRPPNVRRVPIPFLDSEALESTAPDAVIRKSITVSPDGRSIVHIGGDVESPLLVLRRFDTFEAEQLAGTEGAKSPFFSPDGRSVAFFADDELKKTSILGGDPEPLCDAPRPLGGSWGDDGFIYFVTRVGYELRRVSAAGGNGSETVPAVPSRAGQVRMSWPFVLPGASALLICSGTGETRSIDVLSIATGERRLLIPKGSCPLYARSGHLVYARAGTIWAARFDLDTLQTTTPSAPVVRGVQTEPWGPAQFSVSDDGTLVFLPGVSMAEGELVWKDRTPPDAPLVTAWPGLRAYGAFTLTRDGQRLAVQLPGASSSISILDFESHKEIRVPKRGKVADMYPTWTPDEKWIAFLRAEGQTTGIYRWRVDGDEQPEELLTSPFAARPHSFLRDASALAYQDLRPDQWWNIGVLQLNGSRTCKEFLGTPAGEFDPQFSPDGHWMAFTYSASGRSDVYVRHYPDGEPLKPVSIGGSEEPIWSPRGDKLFVRRNNTLVEVAITTEPEFSVGPPRQLFEERFLAIPGPSYAYDAVHDRFLLVKERRHEPPNREIRVIFDWFQELERLVPAN